MSTLYGVVNGVMTLLLIVVFVLIISWTWSQRRREDFERLARLPLEEDASGAGGRVP